MRIILILLRNVSYCVHRDNVEMQTLDLSLLSEDLFLKDPLNTG